MSVLLVVPWYHSFNTMYLHCHLTENIKDKDKPVLLIYVNSLVESEYTFN
jgi:hypothetical protein